MPNRPVPPALYPFLSQLEGRKGVVYLDTGGVPTGGVGHTGPDVPAVGTPISDAQISAWLVADADKAAGVLEDNLIESHVLALDENQWMAMISFAFNLGFRGNWQIAKDINTGLLSDVPAQMIRFDHGEENGELVVIPGLKNRRLAEIALWNQPEAVDHAGDIIGTAPQPSSGYIRRINTPPAPPPPKPFNMASLTTKVVGGVTALGTGATQVQAIIAPHASEAEVFGKIAVALTSVIIVCSVIALFISHKQAQVAAT